MRENEPHTQLQMVWPDHLLNAPPPVQLPPGYTLRTYRPGDESRFYQIMALAGWPPPHPPLHRTLAVGGTEDLLTAGVRPTAVRAGDGGTVAGSLCATGMAVQAASVQAVGPFAVGGCALDPRLHLTRLSCPVAGARSACCGPLSRRLVAPTAAPVSRRPGRPSISAPRPPHASGRQRNPSTAPDRRLGHRVLFSVAACRPRC